MHSTLRSRAALVGAFAFLAVALAGCGAPATTDSGTDSDTDTEQTDGGAFEGVTLSGDGSYAIPGEMPYGSYQMSGEPDSQPDGCTWQILDADGATVYENTGPYVFIDEIDDAATFTTVGCPDWEQYE